MGQPVAVDEGQPRTFLNNLAPFSFLTEIFYFVHRALELGFKPANTKLLQLNQELNRIQRAYQDAQNQPNGSQVVEMIQQRMDQMMSSYLSYKVHIF